jgi:PAS domain S-box-containing protein
MQPAFPQARADFLDPFPVGVFAIDQEGIIVYVNSKQCENSRLTRGELVGKNYRAFFYDTLQSQDLLGHFDCLQQEGMAFEVTFPTYRRHADGTVLALTVKGYQQGGYTFILTIIERALQAEQARFAHLFEHANDGVFILDRQARFVAVNQRFAEMTGLPKAEILGRTTELFLPGGLTQSLERLDQTVREGRFGPYELEVMTPLGTKTFSLNAIACYEGETPVGVMNIARDVTAEHRLTEELRENEERYRNLFENANDAIVTFTLEATVTSTNRGLEALLGWSREELIGQHYRKFITPASAALGEERTRRFLAGERVPSIFEAEMVRKDGSVVPIECRTRAIRDKEGKPVGFQGTYRDISAKKALEQQRAEFLAMLTHDIKNPLSAILGYLDLLQEETAGRLSANEDDFLRRLKDNALTIQSLIANYLDLARVEAGSLVLHKAPQAVGDILRRVTERHEAMARRRRLTLAQELPEDLPLIMGDPLALERVFANLVHNALKFTPETGRVTIAARQWTNGAIGVMVEVRDTGPGIAQAEFPSLFVKYHRATTTRHQEGTGLGLFIVKTLVEAHGGRVEVESRLGSGTCFRVLLPEAPSSV